MIWIPILIWLGAATSLLGPPAIWQGPDPSAKSKGMRAEKVEYRAWTSSPTPVLGGCEFTVFALSTQEAFRRMLIDGVEQGVDWSWRVTRRVPIGEQLEVAFTFIHPVTSERQEVVAIDRCLTGLRPTL